MRHSIIILTVVMAAFAASSPMDFQLRPTRPVPEDRLRLPRSEGVKGRPAGTKTVHPSPPKRMPVKGEYWCGNQICKLEPIKAGETPPCPGGLCQWPVIP